MRYLGSSVRVVLFGLFWENLNPIYDTFNYDAKVLRTLSWVLINRAGDSFKIFREPAALRVYPANRPVM